MFRRHVTLLPFSLGSRAKERQISAKFPPTAPYGYNLGMQTQSWPDALRPPEPRHIKQLLADFWTELAGLGDLVGRDEQLLAAASTARLRRIVLELMLGLNGIAWPEGTRHLNSYLGESQRAAIQKTLAAPALHGDTWVGQAVALVVIYRWYAPQLVERFQLVYPAELESTTLSTLQESLPDWPLNITTD